jgi:hypothetical protein
VRLKFHAVRTGADTDARRYWIGRRRLSRTGIYLVSRAPDDGGGADSRLSTRGRHRGKLNAMVALDICNCRMKDFYDIWFTANTWTQNLEQFAILTPSYRHRIKT